jgi:hypothetical protein
MLVWQGLWASKLKGLQACKIKRGKVGKLESRNMPQLLHFSIEKQSVVMWAIEKRGLFLALYQR